MTQTAKFIDPPNSKEDEMMVLGSMITNINSLNIAAQLLDDADFYYSEHKTVFAVLKNAFQNNKPSDVHLVAEELKRIDKLEGIGGIGYLTSLAMYAGTSAYIEEYIEILQQKSILRKLIRTAQELEKKALKDPSNPIELLEDIEEKLKGIANRKGVKEKFPFQFLDERDLNFLTNDPPKKPMLLDFTNDEGKKIGFLPKGIVGMLTGAGGLGKTNLLAQLGIALATGQPWLMTYYPTAHCGAGNKGSVFLGFGENQYDDIHRLLHKASKPLRNNELINSLLDEASRKICPFSFSAHQAAFLDNGKPSSYFREFKMRLIDKTPPEGWALIVLDPISRMMGADAETDNAAATAFIALLEELTIDLPGNPTVLFAHHVTKASINGANPNDPTAARGSSALRDGVRWQLNATRTDDGMTLKVSKTNFTSDFDQIHLKKDEEGYWERDLNFTNNNQEKKEENPQGNKKSANKRPAGITKC